MSPRICRSLNPCDYAARVPALRLLAAQPDDFDQALDDAMGHPKLREIVKALALMAFAGFAEYYHDDRESIDMTLEREANLAEDLEAL